MACLQAQDQFDVQPQTGTSDLNPHDLDANGHFNQIDDIIDRDILQ
ncbi:hypothetical protein [Vibrio penaeicida]|nr:hypothetical protein [Vibrio penaeicida]